MGGQSSQQQQQNQTQNTQQNYSQNQAGTTAGTSNPWAAAQPLLGGILGSAQGLLGPSTTANLQQQQGLAGLNAQALAGNPFATGISNVANNLLNGGGALQQAPMLQNAYNAFQTSLNPYLNPNYTNPTTNPLLQPVLNTITNDTTNAINSEFAGAGRDLSGLNTQALARGLSQGLAYPLLNQFNTNVGTQLGAAGSLYGAGNTTAGNLTGLNQQYLANQGQGINSASSALAAAQQPFQQLLNIGNIQQQIPQQGLGFLASLGIPIAGLGGTTTGATTGTGTGASTGSMTGTGNVSTTANASPLQQALGWSQVFSNLVNPFSRPGGSPVPQGIAALP
jgi:hypothetical protein